MKKVVLITGSAKGIGKHLTSAFAQKNYTVIATDINVEKLAINKKHWDENVSIKQLNVIDFQAWETVINEVVEEHGQLDIIVNNAGVMVIKDIDKTTQNHIDSQIDINVKGVIYGTTLAAKQMLKQGNGHIINIASLAGIAPVCGLNLYCASKFAVKGYTTATAYELRPKGIFVTAICPDAVDTDMVRDYVEDKSAAMAFSSDTFLMPTNIENAVFKALKGKQLEIIIPWHRGVLAKIGAWFPSLGYWLTGVYTRKGRKKQLALSEK